MKSEPYSASICSSSTRIELHVEAKSALVYAKLFLADGRVLSYASLSAEVQDCYVDVATPEVFARQATDAQSMLDHLADEIAKANADMLIVIGDDQHELFDKSHMPAFAIYTGEDVVMYPKSELMPNLPNGIEDQRGLQHG